jgi:hypothetical protein
MATGGAPGTPVGRKLSVGTRGQASADAVRLGLITQRDAKTQL